MRKIFLTIIMSVFMIGFTYLPFASSFHTLQNQTVISVAHAQEDNPDPVTDPNGDGTTQNGGGGTTQNGGGGTTQNGGGGTTQNGGGGTTQNGGGGTVVSDTCSPTQLCNPLKYDTICDLLTAVLVLVTQIGAMIAVLLIIWTGFKFITAQGNPKKLTDAKNAFITTLIGTAVLLGASAIAQITVKTVLTITNQSNPGVCHI